MKNILVTGGMGFIGSHLVNRLLSLDYNVKVLDKSPYKPVYCNIDSADFIEGDVLSQGLLEECLEDVDICFHLAALSSVAVCNRDWEFSHSNNVLAFNGLLRVLTTRKRFIKLVYASSAAVYGDSVLLPCSENHQTLPCSTYGADKLSNEIYANAIYQLYKIPSIGLRLFNVFGPGQLRSNPYSGVITCFKQALDSGENLKIYGDGQQTRDFVYISDVIDAFLLAADSPKEQAGIYNVCRGSAISIEALARIMVELSSNKSAISYLPPRPGDLRHSLGSPDLAAKELQFQAKIPMEEGLDAYLKADFFNDK